MLSASNKCFCLFLDKALFANYHALMINRKSINLLLIFFVILIAVSCDRQPSYPPAPQNGTNIEIDTSSLETEVPQFHTYLFNGKKISYFVLKIDDRVVSFFDACTSCYPHKMGYSYKDGYVICRYCNLRFSVYKLEKGLGNCYPVKLDGKTVKGRYLIPLKNLEQGAEMF